MKKIIHSFKVLIIAISIVVTVHLAYINQSTSYKDTKNAYLEILNEKECEFWNNITTKTGIKKESCARKVNTKKRYIDPKLSKNIVSIIDEVLIDFNIEPNTISLYYEQTEHRSPAAASPGCIYVREDLLSTYSLEAQKFIIGHELQHIIYNDPYVLEKLEKACNKNDETLWNEFGDFIRFTELRADIKTMLHQDQTYTVGAIHFNEKNLKLYGEHSAKTHPKYGERLKTAQAINAQELTLDSPTLA